MPHTSHKPIDLQSISRLVTGNPAPDFAAPDANGHVIHLSDFRGKKVVLYFYPKDDTPGCTVEGCGFRDIYQKIKATGAEIIGISTDDIASHKSFTIKYNLPFPLAADADGKITELYGVYNEKWKMARRVTFIIDENGDIARVFDPVKPDVHPKEVLEALRA
jgi:thioredoxin-dependent peroxiredoxin